MSALPSIYSDEGLSSSQRHKVLTVGKPRAQRSIGAVKLEERVNDAVEIAERSFDDDGDIPMLGMDDEDEVQLVADYVFDNRQSLDSRDQDSILPTDLISSSIEERDLTPKAKLSKDTIMVIDTNFIISHLNIIDELVKIHVKYHHKIIIPSTVVLELDGLKNSKKKTDESIDGTTIGHLARWANDWIYKQFADSSTAVRGQKVKENLNRDAMKDDAILDCCLYFEQKLDALVILLSNDKNLCMKALSNDILTVSYRKGMSAELIASMSFNQNASDPRVQSHEPELPPSSYNMNHQQETQPQNQQGDVSAEFIDIEENYYNNEYQNTHEIPQHTPIAQQHPIRSPENENSHLITVSDFFDASHLVHKEVQLLVLSAIDHCMYAEYEDDVELVGYDKSNITTLKDCSLTLIRFWMSVFTEYFRTGYFKPFNGRGRKIAQYTDVPRHQEELDKFIKYWSNVLRALYVKRDEAQNAALEKIIERWQYIGDQL